MPPVHLLAGEKAEVPACADNGFAATRSPSPTGPATTPNPRTPPPGGGHNGCGGGLENYPPPQPLIAWLRVNRVARLGDLLVPAGGRPSPIENERSVK